MQTLRRLFLRWLWTPWETIHAEASATEAPAPYSEALGGIAVSRSRLDLRPLVILGFCAVSLTLQEYWGERDVFARLIPPPKNVMIGYWELGSFAWWSGWRVLGYLLLPMLVLKLMGERIGDYGFSVRGFRKHIWIYAALFLAVLPLVVAVSFTAPFQHTYPFYRLANRSWIDFLAWESMYALQFLSLEFFFRGFLLHGLKRTMGVHAIWVMIVPYCMIHFGKPMPETLGAIFAGLVLGTLALKTRSIWCGVLIHISVAVSMDLLSLAHCHGPGVCQ